MSVQSAAAPIRVMIVDDSVIIRGHLKRVLEQHAEIEVAFMAENAAAALNEVRRVDPDIILLDIEMPGMDGITALPELLKLSPRSRVIMVSTLTQRNAEIGLRAMRLGASDYIPKPSARKDSGVEQQFPQELIQKVRALAPARRPAGKAKPSTAAAGPPLAYPAFPVKAIAIGTSTGGPQALALVFKMLARRVPDVPLYITQHMPPTFTAILARDIGDLAQVPCMEGREGDIVQARHIYLAPGNYHMVPQKQGENAIIHLNQEPPVNFCRPAVDPMLQALVKIYGKNLLAVILTGMGSDGLAGSRDVVAAGGTVIAQNEGTCTVWGMPRAVTEHRLCSAVLPLDQIAPYILKACP